MGIEMTPDERIARTVEDLMRHAASAAEPLEGLETDLARCRARLREAREAIYRMQACRVALMALRDPRRE